MISTSSMPARPRPIAAAMPHSPPPRIRTSTSRWPWSEVSVTGSIVNMHLLCLTTRVDASKYLLMSAEEGRGPRVAVIGAGVSGLAMGLRLQAAGMPFEIFEKASEVGGTWRDNRYPGLTIDVPSPIYTYAGDRHAGWRRWMPEQAEILEYHRDVSVRRGLRPLIHFGTEVVAATWTGSGWELRTGDGVTHAFDAVVCAT